MNFHIKPAYSIILMSVRPGAPYSDRIEDDGRLLIYEGHDVPKTKDGPNPKDVDQPIRHLGGRLTQNGLFYEAAQAVRQGLSVDAEYVRVYEKIRDGIWVYNGVFELIDAWQEHDGKRNVFKFMLRLLEIQSIDNSQAAILDHNRFIPSSVKLEVWKRDKGQCVICGSTKNLHFDHIIPFSKGGTSLKSENVQLLCATHNLSKHDRIE
ncbi:MAG: HNH endonuclease [Anaerolineae bacterium]|nr:HNH endonuclease [Anaerolineae bacterium]